MYAGVPYQLVGLSCRAERGGKMDTSIVKLNFTSPIHLGAEGAAVEKIYDFLHSDTLFSSICHAWLQTYGRKGLEELLGEFPKDKQNVPPSKELPFCFSSAFPFVGKVMDGEVRTTYFLPKLKKRPPFPDFEDKPEPKEAKRVKKTLDDMDWIDLSFFWEWAGYRKPVRLKNEDLDPRKWRCLREKLDRMNELLNKAVESDFRPRVTIDRRTGRSLLYFFRLVYFSNDQREGKGGLYFLVKCRDQDMKDRLTTALKFLGETGIGGERSSGYGKFEAEWCELDVDWTIPQKILDYPLERVTLSLYYPPNWDALKPVSNYTLLRRAGWLESPFAPKPQRRLVMYMFEEGTVFDVNKNLLLFENEPRSIPTETLGTLVDVAPEGFLCKIGHSVYRYGLAFTVPVVPG